MKSINPTKGILLLSTELFTGEKIAQLPGAVEYTNCTYAEG